MSSLPFLRVAVGVIRNAQGQVLIAKRAAKQHQGGLWEFPGGKIESGESTAAALARELAEELGIAVHSSAPLIRIPYRYPDRQVVLEVEEITDWQGEPRGLEGQPIVWRAPAKMVVDEFPAANRAIITALQLPCEYVISPDCDDPARWLRQLDEVLVRGASLIQFRVRGAQAMRERLAREALRRCHAVSARLLINADERLAEQIGADGVHLTAAQLASKTGLSRSAGGWLAASCHHPEELQQAAAIGADFAVLSPVAPTASHPQATPLGWTRFAQWVAEAPMPVFALGGMQPDDAAIACAMGGQGVAGISGFWPQAV